MDAYEPLISLGVALAVGLLIGLEREQSGSPQQRSDGLALGGARTYPLFALAGAVSALLARSFGGWVIALTLVGMVGFVVVAYAGDVRAGRDRGLTSEAAFVIVFLLGALAASRGIVEPLGRRVIAVSSVAIAVTVLLSVKVSLQSFVQRVSKEDIFATLKFLIAAVVVLPLLPSQGYGPLGAINPFKSGLMIVLIAAIGFVGYVAVRILGPGKGLGLTGIVGGLVSSTAVTLSFSRLARSQPAIAGPCVMAIVSASAIMFIRVVVEVAVVHRALVPVLAVPLAAMFLGSLAVAGALFLRSRKGPTGSADVSFANPFELSSAVKFGLLFTVVLLASKAATVYLGTGGTYLASVLAGTTDVDAITLSMASLARDGAVTPGVAVTSIMLGVAANTVVKASMAAGIGGWLFGRRIVAAFGAVLAAGAIGLGVMWWRM